MGLAQSYVERPPVPALADLVRVTWIQRTGDEPYVQRNLPTGGVELHCPIGSLPRLVGTLTGPSAEVLPAGTTVVGARFRPGAAAALLGIPGSELVDLTLTLDDLWGGAAVVLGELMAGARSPEAALLILQEQLAHRRAGGAEPDPLVAEAVRQLTHWRAGDIGPLSAQLAISPSQLRRRFQAAAGIGAKALHRTLRFQGFLARVQSGGLTAMARSGDGLAVLAAEAGYADQAHLSRECSRLAGVSPSAFLTDVAGRCGCGHDHSASFVPVLRGGPRRALAAI